MIFAAMATGICFIRPAVGYAAHLYTVAVIAVPRLYLGLHHPTDVVAGLVLGVALAAAFNLAAVRGAVARRPLRWIDEFPSPAYAIGFLGMIQVATMFDGIRVLATEVLSATRTAWCELASRGEASSCRDLTIPRELPQLPAPARTALTNGLPRHEDSTGPRTVGAVWRPREASSVDPGAPHKKIPESRPPHGFVGYLDGPAEVLREMRGSMLPVGVAAAEEALEPARAAHALPE
jgi:PAP2 superfamily